MYVKNETGTERPLMLVKLIEDITGGGVVDPDDFKSTTLEMKEGALLGKDANGIYHIVKTAKLHALAADSATTYQVKKNHEFKVGDYLMDVADTTKAYAITAIDTSNADYDVLTVGTSLGAALAEGALLIQAAAQATSLQGGSFKYSPVGIALNTVDLTNKNLGTGILVRGTVVESILPYFVDSTLKALLPHVRFV